MSQLTTYLLACLHRHTKKIYSFVEHLYRIGIQIKPTCSTYRVFPDVDTNVRLLLVDILENLRQTRLKPAQIGKSHNLNGLSPFPQTSCIPGIVSKCVRNMSLLDEKLFYSSERKVPPCTHLTKENVKNSKRKP